MRAPYISPRTHPGWARARDSATPKERGLEKETVMGWVRAKDWVRDSAMVKDLAREKGSVRARVMEMD